MPSEPVTVTATFERVYRTYAINVAAVQNGTITIDPAAGEAPEESTVTVTATPAEGYKRTALTVTTASGEVIELDADDAEDGKFTFTMPSANVTVSASFVRVDGSTTNTETKPDDTTVETTTKADGSIAAVEVDLSEKAIENAGNSPIVLPIPEIPVTSKSEAPTITVSAPDSGTVSVTVPVKEANSSTVAMLLKEDNTWEIVKKSVLTEDGLTVPLEDGATIKIVDNSKNFVDVPSDNWAADAIAFASSHDLFQGVGKNQFDPNAPMNRGMLVTVLYRLEDTPPTGEVEFIDVSSGAWYADAVAWASKNKIVNGYGDSIYKPEANVTREEFATILYRYATTYMKLNATQRGNLNRFSDGASTSSWAKDAMSWAVGTGPAL